MRINISNWKKIRFNKIFDIKKGFYNKKLENSYGRDIPFLGATDSNNVITRYYSLEVIEAASKTGADPNDDIDKKLFPGNAVCVTNNGSVGFAYY